MYNTQSDSDKALGKRIVSKFDSMKSTRNIWENHWQECYDHIIPRKNDVVTQRMAGEKKNELYDTTAIMSNQLLAGALHGMLTSPSTKFFDLVLEESNIDISEEIVSWLQDTSDKMFLTLQNSNFQTEVHEIYVDLGAIGTACMFMGEHEDKVIHFGARPIKEIMIEENNLGLIDTVYRTFKWKLKHIVQEFGEENLPECVIEQYRKGDDKYYDVIHAVEPWSQYENDEYKDGSALSETEVDDTKSKIFPFKSTYVLKEEGIILSEGGFREFPYAVPRWTKTSGEIYGRGPGMEMLPDIKMVNIMMETVIKGAQKTIDPPLMISDDGVIGKVRLTPGGLTTIRPGADPIRPLITDARVDFGYQAVEDVRKRIRAGFYGDLFQLREGPQMTATEVNTIAEQQMRLMGPVIGRQHFEFLRPIVDRLFGIMSRRKLIKPAPKILQGKKFDVRYSSLIARAQRMNEGTNITRAIQVAAPVMNAIPSVIDNINGDKALKHIFEIYGIPNKIMNTSDEVKKSRNAKAQAQQEAVAQQQQNAQAQAIGQAAPGVAQLMQASKK